MKKFPNPNPNAIKINLERIFAEKPKTFLRKGSIINRWIKVIEQKNIIKNSYVLIY